MKRASCARLAFHVERAGNQRIACATRDLAHSESAFRTSPAPTIIPPHSASGGEPWSGCCAWPIRKAASARRPPRSTWPSCLAKAGERTLLIDLDPQCNATTGLGQQAGRRGIRWSSDSRCASRCCATDDRRTWSCCPAAAAFQDVDALAKSDESAGATCCGSICCGELAGYDFVLIDCPPSLGTLTQTALSASTEVLMPIQCEYFAMEGLTQMIEVFASVMQRFPGRLEFGGILLTMYDPALELTHEVDAEVRDFFGEIVFETVIPRDVAAAEAPSHGRCVIDYAPRSRAARAYIELCMEVLERE